MRRPRFRLRTLMIVVAVLAVLLVPLAHLARLYRAFDEYYFGRRQEKGRHGTPLAGPHR